MYHFVNVWTNTCIFTCLGPDVFKSPLDILPRARSVCSALCALSEHIMPDSLNITKRTLLFA